MAIGIFIIWASRLLVSEEVTTSPLDAVKDKVGGGVGGGGRRGGVHLGCGDDEDVVGVGSYMREGHVLAGRADNGEALSLACGELEGGQALPVVGVQLGAILRHGAENRRGVSNSGVARLLKNDCHKRHPIHAKNELLKDPPPASMICRRLSP